MFVPNFRRLLVLVIFLTPSAVLADVKDIAEAIRDAFPTASPLLIITLGTMAILILGIAVIWEIFKSDKFKQEKSELSWQNFSSLAKENKLDDQQIKMLREIIISSDVFEADSVFNAPSIYEKAVEMFLKHKSKSGEMDKDTLSLLLELRDVLGYSNLPEETHLSSTRQLKPGLKFQISTEDEKDTINGRIIDINEKDWTIEASDKLKNKIGQKINIWFIRHGDAEYQISTEVIRTIKDTFILNHTMDLDRKQLRNWVRVEVNIPAQARVVKIQTEDEESDIDLKAGTNLNGRIIDISGGGICIRLEEQIPTNSTLSLSFDLPENPIRSLHSQVISSNMVKKSENDNFLHRLKFNEIETSLQEKIVRFVFEKNRVDYQFR